jgi:Zn-dependent protease
LAGPFANFSLAVLLAIGFRLDIIQSISDKLPPSIATPLISMCFSGFFINLGLALFNLIPLPPLDGFNILAYFLPEDLTRFIQSYSQFFFFGFLILAATGILGRLITPIFTFFTNLLLVP